ncbi:peptidylprolyl isomerase [Cereibacter sphaeroides]|uniref:peptidylprolyl isomerase n=1 Tax=Cereibacter sphaeroides TaxID=1063 RepID=UPI001F2BB310|nr:peptidylprolyl isomerase [Cereibacter sphaeroides]MCE6961557.1 peptidylprolyl isomerase [Cereibacter sphaeroides]MCE6967872.1 peptidylprolyl isomerase [Cereibacter sphaeroides]MCE6972540.1 peptidylprolyl isomerase [Cereibacter sphaeroides]
MSSDRVLFAGLMSLGVAVIGGYALSQSAVLAQDAVDGPGPNLVIEVAGKAQGEVVIDLLPDVAPQHVERMVTLAGQGAYDGVVFHRVIEGFMAQTGDVQFGKGPSLGQAGMGGSDLPDLPAEFSDISFDRGVVGMARSASPDSANSQFFIMFAPGDFLNGKYTVVGRVVQGMDVVDEITRGEPPRSPDVMQKVSVAK